MGTSKRAAFLGVLVLGASIAFLLSRCGDGADLRPSSRGAERVEAPARSPALAIDAEPAAPRVPAPAAAPSLRVLVRLAWGTAPADARCALALWAEGDGSAPTVHRRASCTLPGSASFDLEGLSGPLLLTASAPFGVLAEPARPVEPYPEELELVLAPRGGLVVDVLEAPSPGGQILVEREDADDLDAQRPEGRWALLTEPTRLEYARLLPSWYRVELSSKGKLPSPRHAQRVEVRAGERSELALPNFLADVRRIEGRVTWRGEALPGHRIGLRLEESGHGAVTQTDSDGRFGLELLGAGSATLTVDGSGIGPSCSAHVVLPIEVPSDPDPFLDIELPTGGIRGRVVVEDPARLEGVRLIVFPLTWRDARERRAERARAILDGSGRYTVKGLTPGRYDVRLAAAPGTVLSFAGALAVEVEDELARAPDLVATARVRVSGQLVWQDAAAPPASLGDGHVLLCEDAPDGRWLSVARSALDGSWSAMLPPGRHRLYVLGGRPALASLEPLVVELAPETFVPIPVAAASARASFRVADPRSGRYLRCTFECTDLDGRSLPVGGTWSTDPRSAPLVPGRYRFVLRPEGEEPLVRELELEGGREHALELMTR